MPAARLLIVEDERITAEDLPDILTELGYVVVSIVSTGSAAIAAVEREAPDLGLMDIQIQGGPRRYADRRHPPRADRHSDCLPDRSFRLRDFAAGQGCRAAWLQRQAVPGIGTARNNRDGSPQEPCRP
jgi:Response regulator receiver domain